MRRAMSKPVRAISHAGSQGERGVGSAGGLADRAVVVTVTFSGTCADPARVNEAGEGVQVAPCGAPLHRTSAEPLKPLKGVREISYVAGWPAVTVTRGGG